MAFVVGKPKRAKPQKAKTNNEKMLKGEKAATKPAAPKPKAPPVDQALAFGSWWIENKYTVRSIAILTGFVIGGLLLLYGIYGLADHYLIKYSRNQRLFEPRTVSLNWEYINQISTPSDIQIGKASSIRAGENYDLIATVKNPNDKWYVSSMTYYFEVGGATTDAKSSYVLPGETMYLVDLNNPSGGSANLVIEDLEWKKEPDYAQLKEQLMQFDITDVEYIAGRQSQIVGETPINQVSFSIKNKSPQNFWNIDLIILLYAGTQIRAVNLYNLNSLDSLEQKDITINWPGALPAINKVTVIPQIDILNPESYKGFGEVIGEQK